MKVLIACEESQTVCIAFRNRGHEAYSCDLQEPSGGHPEWHIHGDALQAISGGRVQTMDGATHDVGKWDLLIAHPPCTFLTNSSAVRMRVNGRIVPARYYAAMDAKRLFMAFLNANIPRIAIENPMPLKVVNLPRYTQMIEPYQFGLTAVAKTQTGNTDAFRDEGNATRKHGQRPFAGLPKLWRNNGGATTSAPYN